LIHFYKRFLFQNVKINILSPHGAHIKGEEGKR